MSSGVRNGFSPAAPRPLVQFEPLHSPCLRSPKHIQLNLDLLRQPQTQSDLLKSALIVCPLSLAYRKCVLSQGNVCSLTWFLRWTPYQLPHTLVIFFIYPSCSGEAYWNWFMWYLCRVSAHISGGNWMFKLQHWLDSCYLKYWCDS